MTGLSQITVKLNEDNMDALDTEYVEVSWHSGARPSHQVWQGKVFHWDRGVRGKKAEKALTNDGESGIINSGAVSGALDRYSQRANDHAVR